ncbi:MAG: hypothetical protein CSA84_01170 [Actinomycetales bacterium]|nr:MAG: hypothetical protein CSA84_01170 [Actinomycetales bacterium]
MTGAPDGLSTTRGQLGRLLHVGRIVLLLVVIVAAGLALRRHWGEVTETVASLSWRTWLPSMMFVPIAIGCSTMSWQAFVDELGEPIGAARGAQIFLVGQLGKYVPGSVWAYVLQLELGRRAGLARARIFAATVFSIAVAVVAALISGSMAIPAIVRTDEALSALTWLYLLLPVGVVCLHPRILSWAARQGFRILRRPAPAHPIRKRAVARSLGWALAAYGCFGVHLWLLTREVAVPTFENLGLTVGTMALAMISGLFFFLLPSGAGVREAVIVAALAPWVGIGRAVGYAAVSRVMLTVGDLLMAGGAALLAVFENRRHGRIPPDPGLVEIS